MKSINYYYFFLLIFCTLLQVLNVNFQSSCNCNQTRLLHCVHLKNTHTHTPSASCLDNRFERVDSVGATLDVLVSLFYPKTNLTYWKPSVHSVPNIWSWFLNTKHFVCQRTRESRIKCHTVRSANCSSTFSDIEPSLTSVRHLERSSGVSEGQRVQSRLFLYVIFYKNTGRSLKKCT